MAYTSAQAIDQVRVNVNEATGVFFDDAEIEQWIIQGCLDVSAKSRCGEVIQTITLVAGTPSYVLATNTIGVDTAFIDNKALAKLKGRQFGHIHGGTDALPSHFSYHGGNIRFFGTPQQAATVTLQSWVITNDIDLIPDHYQLLVIDYATIRAKVKDRKFQEAAQLYAIYARSLQFMRNDLQDYVPDSRESLGFPDRIQVQQNG